MDTFVSVWGVPIKKKKKKLRVFLEERIMKVGKRIMKGGKRFLKK